MTERSDKHKQLDKFGEFVEPNWNHARVQKAAAQAIAFIEAYFSRYAAKGMFAGELYAGVGRPDRPLGKFIHEAVLIRSGTYVVANPAKDIKGVPFSYRYDPAALDYMKSKLPKDTDLLMLSAVEVEANVASKLEESNPVNGTTYKLRIVQGGAGSFTVTWPTIKWAGGVAPTLSTAVGAEDIITLYYNGTSYYGHAVTGFA